MLLHVPTGRLAGERAEVWQAIVTRTKERLLEVGRSKRLSTGIKLEKLGATYEPRDDTAARAFVRMIAASVGDAEGAEA